MKLRFTRSQTIEVNLLREPTAQEVNLIKSGNMFDTDSLVDWENEEICEEDYSYSKIELSVNKRVLFNGIVK